MKHISWKYQADIDNSGTIDYGEFIAATLHINKVEKEDKLFAAFSYFDKDGSGYITQDELQKACEEFGIGDTRLEDIIGDIDQDNVSRGYLLFLFKWAITVCLILYILFRRMEGLTTMSLLRWCKREIIHLGERDIKVMRILVLGKHWSFGNGGNRCLFSIVFLLWLIDNISHDFKSKEYNIQFPWRGPCYYLFFYGYCSSLGYLMDHCI